MRFVISFGKNAQQEHHTFRHVLAAGLNAAQVRLLVREDVESVRDTLASGVSRRRILYGGESLEYTAFKFADGSINVGRITVR